MRSREVFARLVCACVVAASGIGAPFTAGAQTAADPPHQHTPASGAGEQGGQEGQTPPPDQHAGHDMAAMASMTRDASGTAWQPDATPMLAIHAQSRGWQFMLHENVFIQWLHESGDRGGRQAGSINWVMGMAQRKVGAGDLGVRAMISLESWTIGGCGYPDLLATGERCGGQTIHDRQHPHDLFMELAVEYDAPIRGSMRWQVYGGPAGEPALGPVAYPHRLSAMPNPLAPMSHHWLDATHITFGVATAAVYGARWKAETSVFNGREPDERRTDIDFGALDSVSGRVWFLPTANWALQLSAGRLTDAEPAEDSGSGIDVTRATASATYQRAVGDNSSWATTLAWGRNAETGHATHAFLAETNLTLGDRHTWFGRFELAGKTPHDLTVAETAEVFTLAKLQGGYTRHFRAWHGFAPGLGGVLSAGIVPEALKGVYGRRVNVGLGFYMTLRPAARQM